MASADYARGVGVSLKAQVYEALRHVAQGLLDYRPNHLQPDPDTLKALYDNALIVLYAEARDLLPVRENAGYRESYSLESIKKAIQKHLAARKPLLPNTATLWAQLKALFSIIDEGSPPLGVATFNGGLFDPRRHPFLEQYAVGDQHLQQAIDKLARVDGQFVDYRDLAERHLGTIYEGLLEFHLEQVDPPDRGWTIDLKTEKGERKASGSYYPPDYIVKYIVEETLGPVLGRAAADAVSEQEKIAAILGVKVLDPAMGSGHFPVEATEYIARFLMEHIEQPPTDSGGEADLAYWKRRVAQSCIYGVDLNPLAVDLAKLSLWLATVAKNRPLSFLDHHLRCGNSLIGAHLADLRIATTGGRKTSGKKAQSPPAQGAEAAQPMLFDDESLRQAMTTAVDLMWLIESSPAQTVAEVKEQEQSYSTLRQKLTEKYGILANLVSATQFGLAIDPALWKPLADYATGKIGIAPPQFDTWLETARAFSALYRFFHWELEFPEVFFDRHGQLKGAGAGFDVVIGNPPYVRQEELGPFNPYFAAAYPETYSGIADLYVYFYQQGLRLIRVSGRMSYIVTNKWMRAGYGEPLRAYFAREGALERIVDFGHARIFEDADVFPCILVLEKPMPQLEHFRQSERQVRVLHFPREQLEQVIRNKGNLRYYIQEHSYSLLQSRFSSMAWNLESSAVDDLLAKIRRVGVPLGGFAGVKPYYGIKTGLNEAFLIDTPTKNRLMRDDPRAAEVLKPYFRGQDVKRWSPQWAGLWMIVLKSSGDYSWPWSGADVETAERLFRQTFPSLYEHLKPLEEKLRKRQDKGHYWWELRACSYYNVFERPKIIHTDITWRPQFALSDTTAYLLNTAYMWLTDDLYLLAVVNSPLLWAYMWRNAMHGKDEALRLIYSFIETVPIAPPNEGIRAEVVQAVARSIEITRITLESRQLVVNWLRTEFDVLEPGVRLGDFTSLDQHTFVEEVRKHRAKTAGKLSPAALKSLQSGYDEQTAPLQHYRTEATMLEHKLSDLINAAYGLTPEEVALLWATAPPRMPLSPLSGN